MAESSSSAAKSPAPEMDVFRGYFIYIVVKPSQDSSTWEYHSFNSRELARTTSGSDTSYGDEELRKSNDRMTNKHKKSGVWKKLFGASGDKIRINFHRDACYLVDLREGLDGFGLVPGGPPPLPQELIEFLHSFNKIIIPLREISVLWDRNLVGLRRAGLGKLFEAPWRRLEQTFVLIDIRCDEVILHATQAGNKYAIKHDVEVIHHHDFNKDTTDGQLCMQWNMVSSKANPKRIESKLGPRSYLAFLDDLDESMKESEFATTSQSQDTGADDGEGAGEGAGGRTYSYNPNQRR